MSIINAILFVFFLTVLTFAEATPLSAQYSASELSVTSDATRPIDQWASPALDKGTFEIDRRSSMIELDDLDERGLSKTDGPVATGLEFAESHNYQCNAKFPHPYEDSNEDKVKWAATHFCNHNAFAKQNVSAPIFMKVLSKKPWEWVMGPNDEPDPFLHRVGRGDFIGQQDVYEMSVSGIKKEEDNACAVEGGEEDGHNNLWRHDGKLCEDFFYSAWRHCFNDGRGGSVDVACVRYKIDTVY